VRGQSIVGVVIIEGKVISLFIMSQREGIVAKLHMQIRQVIIESGHAIVNLYAPSRIEDERQRSDETRQLKRHVRHAVGLVEDLVNRQILPHHRGEVREDVSEEYDPESGM